MTEAAHSKIMDPEKYVRKITWIGLVINTLLAGIKFAAGYWDSSHTVIADAIHSLSDGATDIAVICISYYWFSPPDASHPYGHRRFETLVTVIIGFVLLFAGIGIVREALIYLHEERTTSPGFIALGATAISIVSKEMLYRWTARAGKKVKSSALAANAWHHRLDALSSIPAFIAVGAVILLPQWTFIDCVGAIVVSIFIFQAALKIIWSGISELVDAGAPVETCEKIKSIANRSEQVVDVHGVRTRYVSGSLHIDLHVVVDGSIPVREGHRIALEVKERLVNEGPDVLDVNIFVEPEEHDNLDSDC